LLFPAHGVLRKTNPPNSTHTSTIIVVRRKRSGKSLFSPTMTRLYHTHTIAGMSIFLKL
jgi:hypothetical protein